MNNFIECPECKCHVSDDKDVCTWCSASLSSIRADRQFTLGQNKYYSKEYDSAITSFNKAIELDLHHHQAWTAKVNTLKQLGKEEDISDNLNRMLDVNVKYSSVWYDMGKYLYKIEHHGESVSALMQTIEKEPNHPKAWALLVDAFGKTANNKKIKDIFSRALDQNSSNAALWYNLGRSLLELEKYHMALTAFDKSIDLDPDHPKIWGLMVNTLSKSGKSDRIDEYVRKALDKKPKKPYIWSTLAKALERLGLYEKALEVYEAAIETFKEEKHFFLGRGQVLTKLGMYEAAIVDIERAIEMYPEIITLSHSMGVSLHGLGKYEDAINAYNREIELLKWRLDTCDPKDSMFSQIMDYLKSNLVAVFNDNADSLKRLGLKEQAEEAYSNAKQYKSQ